MTPTEPEKNAMGTNTAESRGEGAGATFTVHAKTVILSAARTPIGAFLGSLSAVRAPHLGAAAIKAAIERAKLEPGQIDEVFMGNVLSAGIGQAPARQAMIYAGLPNTVPATTVTSAHAEAWRHRLHCIKSPSGFGSSPDTDLFAWVVMPEHVHLVLMLEGRTVESVGGCSVHPYFGRG